MENYCKIELFRNQLQKRINMLYIHFTEKLIGLQRIFVKKVSDNKKWLYNKCWGQICKMNF